MTTGQVLSHITATPCVVSVLGWKKCVSPPIALLRWKPCWFGSLSLSFGEVRDDQEKAISKRIWFSDTVFCSQIMWSKCCIQSWVNHGLLVAKSGRGTSTRSIYINVLSHSILRHFFRGYCCIKNRSCNPSPCFMHFWIDHPQTWAPLGTYVKDLNHYPRRIPLPSRHDFSVVFRTWGKHRKVFGFLILGFASQAIEPI